MATLWRLCGDRALGQAPPRPAPYLSGMFTPTPTPCTDLNGAMSSLPGPRLIDVARPEGDAIVVLAVGGTEVARWPLAGSAQPDLDVIDALARLALGARRLGGEIRLRNAGPELLGLIDFVGLDDVLVAQDSGRR